MSHQHQYQSYLSDLLALMQEAIIRFFTKKPIDTNKFKHCFLSIYHQMSHLESQFHHKQQKYTKHFRKLELVLGKEDSPFDQQIEIVKLLHQQNNNDRPPEKPVIRFKSKNKSNNQQFELNSIEEVQQQHLAHTLVQNKKKRSGTAGGLRNKVNTIEANPQRPFTGTRSQRNRYRNQTINQHEITQQFPFSQDFHTISARLPSDHRPNYQFYEKTQRKSFYNQLQKQRQAHQQGNFVVCEEIRIPIQKKRCVSNKKWSQKISRLL